MSEGDEMGILNQDMILGEMRGQLRELVHNVNNLSAKVDALGQGFTGLSREVGTLVALVGDVALLKVRLDSVEKQQERREGAAGIVKLIGSSPALGWLVGAAITAWAILTGKVEI